ncbi:hypothetical protein B4U80_00202, partial [Leptotrombidium deliense]
PITLLNWNHNAIFEKIIEFKGNKNNTLKGREAEANVPTLYTGKFKLEKGDLYDTFLQVNNWRKGVAMINGFNLGRYWPAVGPQETLYIPATLLKKYPDENTLQLFELEESPCVNEEKALCTAFLVDKPSINATVPYH